jgi:hypothetical protein
MRRRPPHRRPRLVAALAGAGALAALPAAAEAADPPMLYLNEEAASVIHDALGGPTLRQAPIRPNPRWAAPGLVGKVTGGELAGDGPARIAAELRAGWRQPGVGNLVAVDEIRPRQWTAQGAQALAKALRDMGSDAHRVIFYASPAFVEQVGRADPRRPLPARTRWLFDAVARGRATYLQTYRGDLSPLPPREMASAPTRWLARWPADGGELRLLLGPDGGLGQAELWSRVRSTPAGREMLARGPGAYGLRGTGDAREWLAQYRSFQAAPTRSVTGVDYPVPQPGGLVLEAAGPNRIRLQLTRPGNAVVTTQRLSGGFVRAIRKLTGPTAEPILIPLPRDTRPGRYRVRAVLIGDGLKDRAGVIVTATRRR